MRLFRRHIPFLILLGMVFHSGLLTAQDRKPPALLNKLVSLGPISETQRQIIFNHLQTQISNRFELISQRRFDEAQNAAFEELDYDECTEENCVRFIQDALQVENFFSLQLVQEGDITQMTLTMIDLDRKVVKSDVCQDCSVVELNDRVTELVQAMTEEVDFDRLLEDAAAEETITEKPASQVKDQVAFAHTLALQFESGSTVLNQLIPELSDGDEIKISWGIPGFSYGFGTHHYVEGSFFSGSGTTDPFYFTSGSGVLLAESVEVRVIGFYYTPANGGGFIYGLGSKSWLFSFNTAAGSKNISTTVPLVDLGYQFFGEGWPLTLKYGLTGKGAVINASFGVRF